MTSLYSANCFSRPATRIPCRPCNRAVLPRRLVQVYAGDGNFLSKLGRVFKEKAQGDFDRLFKGTSKARERLGVVEELFTYWKLDEADEYLEELEEALIASDFGPRTALRIVDGVREEVKRGQVKTSADMRHAVKTSLLTLLTSRGGDTELQLGDATPAIILIVGVNGSGKTTTVGKLAHMFSQQDATVVLAAADTFRAAAAEQLQEWAHRAGSAFVGPVSEKQRPAGVIKRAIDEGVKTQADVILCDTSGRLHTNWNLMEELAGCKRAIEKRVEGGAQEVLLVLDGTTGLNMLNQAREFHETVQLTGIVLTKLDGTARGGAVVSVVDELGVPVKFVGVGEGLEDLRPFDVEQFVNALFPEEKGDGEDDKEGGDAATATAAAAAVV